MRGAIRVGDWKLVLNGHVADTEGPAEAEVEKAPELSGDERLELFNLASDPSEAENVAAKNPKKVKELRARYGALAKQQIPPKTAPKSSGFKTPAVWGESN